MSAVDQRRCVRFFVSGHVQGVFFRKYTKLEADRLGLSGWVRNIRDDGNRVETVACGSSEQLQEFHAFLEKGSPKSTVTAVERIELPADHRDSLAVRKSLEFLVRATK